jgi:predicted nucleic acid-binding protein
VNVTTYFKAVYLDASAAVKLVLSEPGSDSLNEFFMGHHPFYISTICFAESLGVLKRQMIKSQIDRTEYFRMCFKLVQLVKDEDIQIEDPDPGNVYIFFQMEEIARRHNLDLSDALQIVSLKHGRFSKLSHECKSVLITADVELAKAAKAEGLRVWNLTEEPQIPRDLPAQVTP